MLSRNLESALRKARRSILLLGPRQTGKSTLMRALQPDLVINLAMEGELLKYARDPDELPAQLRARQPKLVFIDEIQRLPSLLNTVQGLIDDGGPRFLLTGSSARKLRRGNANLLPGRILMFELGPLSVSELGDDFDENRALAYGTLPGIYLDDDRVERERVLDTYAAVYVKEEIQAEALTRNIEGFSRFLYVAAARNGDFVDFTKLASDAGIQRKTATRFFEILEETLVARRLEAFAKTSYRRLIQHPRLYFFDTGVLNALLGSYSLSADRSGKLFETLVFNQLLAEASGRAERIRLSTYRTENNAEVDFILEKGKETWAIEVKASRNVGKSDLRGLKSFAEFFGKKHHPVVVHRGPDEKIVDGVLVTNLKGLLTRLGF